HGRLTEWLFPFMFAMISLVIAGDSRSHRQTRLHPMVTALLLAFALRWLCFLLKNMVRHDAIYTPLIYAFPRAVIGGSAYLLLTRRTIQMPKAVSRWVSLAVRKIQHRLAARSSSGGGA